MVVARGWGRGNRKLFNGYNVSVMQDKKGSRVHLGRRQWHPTPVLLPGKSYGQRSLVGCSPWGHQESDATKRLPFHFMHWRRKWQPTPVFLPGESQGRRNLVGCRLWGRTESDTTEATQQQQQQRLVHLMIQGYIERINLTEQQVYISKRVSSKLLSSSAKNTTYLIHPKT